MDTIIDDSEDSSSDSEDSYEGIDDQEREIMSYLDKIKVQMVQPEDMQQQSMNSIRSRIFSLNVNKKPNLLQRRHLMKKGKRSHLSCLSLKMISKPSLSKRPPMTIKQLP